MVGSTCAADLPQEEEQVAEQNSPIAAKIETIEDFRATAFDMGYDFRLTILRLKESTPLWIKETNGKFSESIESYIKSVLRDAFLEQGIFEDNDRGNSGIFEFDVTRDGSVPYEEYTGANWNAFLLVNCVGFMLGYGEDKFSNYIKSRLSLDFELQDTELKEKLTEQDNEMDKLLESLSNYNILDRQNDIDQGEIKSKIDVIKQNEVNIFIESGINEREALMCVQESFRKKIENSMRELDMARIYYKKL